MTNNETSATIRLRDGRQLGYAEYGDLRGAPVMHFHGHPGSRLEAALLEGAAQEVGVRVIGVDRPGMGLSTPLPKRRLLDWPDDVLDLADALGLERFAVEGISGGGPYAIACAAAIPERLTSCGILAGVGPVAELGTAGMMRTNRLQFFIARRLPWVLRPAFWLVLGRHRAAADDEVKLDALATQLVGSFPAVDRQVLTDREARLAYARSVLEAFRQGSRGAAWDAVIYARPWGFRLGDVQADRVLLWHGGRDVHVPIRIGRAVATAIPGCEAHIFPEEGHISVALRRLPEILRALVSDSNP